MNIVLEKFARDTLKSDLLMLPDAWQLTFKRMYAGGDLDKYITDVVDEMHYTKLDAAMFQVQNSLTKVNVTGWQPIATAPKDGTKILLCVPSFRDDHDDEIMLCWWNDHGTPQQDYSAWEWGNDYINIQPEDPTHWMPLPMLPKK